MDISELYKKLLDVLPQNSIEVLIQTACIEINQHITVLTPSYNVLYSWPQEKIGDTFWDAQQELGSVPDDLLVKIFENNYPDATFSGVTYINWGPIKYPRAVSTLIYDQKSLGHVSIYHTDETLSREEVCDACLCLDRVLKIYFLNSSSFSGSPETILSALASKIFLGQNISNAFQDEWLRITGNNLKGSYIVLAFRKNDLRYNIYEFVNTRLNSIHKCCAPAEIDDYSYILIYGIPNSRYIQTLVTRIQEFIGSQRIHAGISQHFDNLEEISKYMYQGRKALSFGVKNEKGAYLHSFNSLRSQIMLSYIKQHMERPNYIHPLLIDLKKEDEENGTQYYNTLITYLSCMCDSAQASEKLFIHRNTMLYRLKHIEEMYDISLKDYPLVREIALSAWVCSANFESDVL